MYFDVFYLPLIYFNILNYFFNKLNYKNINLTFIYFLRHNIIFIYF